MAEATQIMYTGSEILKLMLKDQGIKEGNWVLALEFGFSAVTAGPTPETSMPSAIVGVGKVGLQRVDAANLISVDAAKIGT
ncbi:hypothetical protein KIV45_15965 [Janthinobacterium lividum]|nr:hypothetical protein KIV45_15965 [Janthinobacterium lividum]